MSFQNRPYTFASERKEVRFMPKKKTSQANAKEKFGERLARLRQAAGYTQRSLSAAIGMSQRMIAYYEIQAEHPPTHLLSAIADALGVTTDQLLGREPVSPRKAPRNEDLLRKLRQLEKLPPRARRAVIETIDALIAKYGKAS